MTSLFVFWQNPENRSWSPVGILDRTQEGFEFLYTRGAKEADCFIPFGRMTDLYKRYRSTDLFPFFANRVLSAKRPEYGQFIHWIAAEHHASDPLVILSRTGGKRATDSLVLYSKPEPNERGEFDLLFLCHGIEYLPRNAPGRISMLDADETLFAMFDVLNPYDPDAIALRTGDPRHLIGYVPRFFAKELKTCIELARTDDVHLRVARVNHDAPLQFRLLCRFTSPWPAGFRPWNGPEYRPLLSESARQDALETSAAR
jgi:hypothetical protein